MAEDVDFVGCSEEVGCVAEELCWDGEEAS